MQGKATWLIVSAALGLLALPALCRAADGATQAADALVQSVTVKAINFAGNRVTQAKVMLRELPYTVGDAADPTAIEKGRQSILDLGLFKSVKVAVVSDADGIAVTYTVKEKFYILPLPRIDANVDGQYAYGLQLGWDNVWGLNHSLDVMALLKERQQAGVGTETLLTFSYNAPFVFDSPWSLGFSASNSTKPLDNANGHYQEKIQAAQVLASRSLSPGLHSQGWIIGGGLQYSRQDTSGVVAPYGEVTAPIATLNYRNLRFKVYSEEGVAFGSRLELAAKGLASDYNYSRLAVGGIQYLPLGSKPHQTVHLIAQAGVNWDGPTQIKAFGLGGSQALRGYDPYFREGNAYYRVAVEFARPVGCDWLRVVAIAEAGNVFNTPSEISFGRTYTSLGIGLRLRLPAFVRSQFEFGIAFPVGGGHFRTFGGRVN